MTVYASDISQAITFASQLYWERARVGYAGYVRQDPMAQLELRPGRANPYPIYARLRAAGPLTRTREGQWVSTSHRVCDAVLRDRRFGVHLDGSPPEFDISFLSMNPPDHTRLRRLALPAFSPKAVATYQPRIERAASDLIDRASAAGQFDLVSGFSAALPITVITDLLGIPDSLSADFGRLGSSVASALDGVTSLRHARQLEADHQELVRLFEYLLELRRREPRGDIVSHLVAAEGDQVTPHEMLSMCMLLLTAGFETTVNLLSNAVLALLGHPAQWKALCADPEQLAPRVVDETLRWDPPVQRTVRTALSDHELAGQIVRRGEKVITLIGAANRDPEVYRDPDTFDIMREPEIPHLAFSSGIHYCLGQPLAKLEATVAITQLATRMPGLARCGSMTWRDATTMRGPLRVPMTAGPLPVPAKTGAR